ncbi:MAG: glycoside hydrolase family 13 protein [Clostridia bacterium]|nr:glycoside hydrolase family 13 protein [Clostridia bacterium]
MSFGVKDKAVLKTESKLCDNAQLFGAFPQGDRLTFTVTADRRLGVSKLKMRIYTDSAGTEKFYLFEYVGMADGCDKYKFTVELNDLGLFYYDVSYEDINGICYLKRDEQLSVFDPSFTTPDWIKGGMIYQIFVDRFNRGGEVPVRDDAVMMSDWENGEPEYAKERGGRIPNNTFFGGTLYGVIDKLEYIASLGVNCIYLCPIFKAYSNHKYDTADYETVDEMFGGDEAFDLLIARAKELGIGIILDGVFNHTGDDSKYFNRYRKYGDGGAYNDLNSPYSDWYTFKKYPDEYECWWNIDILPRVKSDCDSYRKYILGENGIIRKYLKKGIAGWRLDVADELSDSFLAELRSSARSENKEAFILGEVWEDASNKISYGKRKSYLNGRELDSVMNYVIRDAIISFVRNGNAEEFAEKAETQYRHYPKCVSDVLMNILGTHDTGRILNELGADFPDGMTNDEACAFRLSPEAKEKAKQMLKSAWLICATVPGVPCVYYGDEAGMEGWSDPFCRRPFPWGREDTELTEYYKAVGSFRKKTAVYREGVFKIEYARNSVLAFSRSDANDCIYTVSNMSDREIVLPDSTVNCLTGRIIKKIKSRCTVVVKRKKCKS